MPNRDAIMDTAKTGMRCTQVAINQIEVELVDQSEDDSKPNTKSSQFLAGIALAALSSLCFAITSVIAKMTTNVSRSQLAFFRYFGNISLA